MSGFHRRGVLESMAGVALAVPAVLLAAACGDEDDGGDQTGGTGGTSAGQSCPANGTTVTISNNHGHVLTVSAADVAAAVEKTYAIRGDSPHAHSVTLNETDFSSIGANKRVTVTSTSGGGHTHQITVICT